MPWHLTHNEQYDNRDAGRLAALRPPGVLNDIDFSVRRGDFYGYNGA